MSERTRQFDAALKRIITPRLADLDFIVDRRLRDARRTASADARQFVQITSFQIGTKRFAGSFTVNLGVYCEGQSSLQVIPGRVRQPEVGDCYFEMMTRIGFLAEPRASPLGRLIGIKSSAPRDRWWRVDKGQSAFDRTMTEVCDILLKHGIPWLEETSTNDVLEHARAALAQRKLEKGLSSAD